MPRKVTKTKVKSKNGNDVTLGIKAELRQVADKLSEYLDSVDY